MPPPLWSEDQLAADADIATAAFRRDRLDEPLHSYSSYFDAFVPVFRELIERLPLLASADGAALVEMIKGEDRLTAFRYLTAPPISRDDLKTLAETSLSARALQRNRDQALRVCMIVLHILDRHRFPWIAENRDALEHEREQAVLASAALVAAKKVETARRKSGKDVQEEEVQRLLTELTLTKVERRPVRLLDDAPGVGSFCGESKLGDTRADLIVRLFDRRVMPIECKVSNSATNSFKRLIHEAAGKAAKWQRHFGERAAVPVAVLSGVYSVQNLLSAQHGGLVIIWAHRLDDLGAFIESTRA